MRIATTRQVLHLDAPLTRDLTRGLPILALPEKSLKPEPGLTQMASLVAVASSWFRPDGLIMRLAEHVQTWIIGVH